jgi:hypothetical protein
MAHCIPGYFGRMDNLLVTAEVAFPIESRILLKLTASMEID